MPWLHQYVFASPLYRPVQLTMQVPPLYTAAHELLPIPKPVGMPCIHNCGVVVVVIVVDVLVVVAVTPAHVVVAVLVPD